MNESCNRREFLQQVAVAGTAAAGLQSAGSAAEPAKELPKVPDRALTVITGKPRERGKQYGTKFKDAIHAFLDKEIYQAFAKHSSKEEKLRYAGQCTKAIRKYSPLITDELEGMAEGAGLPLEEV